MNNAYEQPPSFLQRAFQEETAKFFHKIILIPPLSVMVCLRRNIGYRLLQPIGVLAIFAIYAFFTNAPMLSPFFLFASISATLGIIHRIVGWLKHRRGKPQHSFYIGDSIFETARSPRFLRKHRLISRFFDPVLVISIGLLLLKRFPDQASGLGGWLIISGAMLFCLEIRAHQTQFERDLDMVDGMVYSEHQGDTVERFEESPKETLKQSTDGIATGLGSDIEQKIKQRRRR